MNGIDLVMLFAIILTARLGMRLFQLYMDYRKEQKNKKKNGEVEEVIK